MNRMKRFPCPGQGNLYRISEKSHPLEESLIKAMKVRLLHKLLKYRTPLGSLLRELSAKLTEGVLQAEG